MPWYCGGSYRTFRKEDFSLLIAVTITQLTLAKAKREVVGSHNPEAQGWFLGNVIFSLHPTLPLPFPVLLLSFFESYPLLLLQVPKLTREDSYLLSEAIYHNLAIPT